MLMRFDPYREVDDLFRQAGLTGQTRRFLGMPMDAFRREDAFVIALDLPGVAPDSIDLTVEQGVLQVTARREALFGDDDQIVVAERPTGEVSRQVFLGDGLDADHIEAAYEAGVLTIRIPVAEQAKPQRIAIQSRDASRHVAAGGEQSQPLEAQSS